MIDTLLSKCFIAFLVFYQRYLSLLKAPSCRFYPSCSSYAKQSLELHGMKGMLYAVIRVLKCHPFCGGGYDPVPPLKNTDNQS